MATLTPNFQTFSRAKGHNAVEAAAYRSGEILVNEKLRPLRQKDVAHLPEDQREKVLAEREFVRNEVIERRLQSRMDYVKNLPEEKQNKLLTYF